MKRNYTTLDKIQNEFGDSYYLLDSKKFEENYSELLSKFSSIYSNTIIAYSYKTNYTPKLCKIINRLGGFAEVVSEMEYDLAISIGVSPDKIIVNGPYKTRLSLIKYFTNGSIVNLDSMYEVDSLITISSEFPEANLRVGLRCNFKISDAYTSRFGFDIESDEFIDIFNRLDNIENVSVEGIHCHFPDRNLELFGVRVTKMLSLSKRLFKKNPKYIDIGGGFFGKMPEFLADQFSSEVPSYEDYAKTIAVRFHDAFKNDTIDDRPKLIIEPGSAIVADTLKFVTKVIDIKKIKHKYIAVTAGSKFNLGSFSSKLNLPMTVVSERSASKNYFYKSIDISGYTCIESDYLFKNYIGNLCKGDFLVFDNVGSYSVVLKPPFILPNVPILEIEENGKIRVIKRKENLNDIFATFSFE